MEKDLTGSGRWRVSLQLLLCSHGQWLPVVFPVKDDCQGSNSESLKHTQLQQIRIF